jgi:hypothetical protein
MKKYLQVIAGLVLGLIIPATLLSNVITSVSTLNEQITHKEGFKQVVEHFKSVKQDLETSNDYALISMLAAENANQKTMINKQAMKVAVIQIGFSVISIGLLFVVLGFNDGGVTAVGGDGNINFNIKTGSTGLAAIIVGASMATMGGVLKNEYKTVQVPMYSGTFSAEDMALSSCEELFNILVGVQKRDAIAECMKSYIIQKKTY